MLYFNRPTLVDNSNNIKTGFFFYIIFFDIKIGCLHNPFHLRFTNKIFGVPPLISRASFDFHKDDAFLILSNDINFMMTKSPIAHKDMKPFSLQVSTSFIFACLAQLVVSCHFAIVMLM